MTSASSADPIRLTPGFSQPRPASVSQPISFRRRRYRSSRQASTVRLVLGVARRHPAGRKMSIGAGRGTDAHVRRPPAVDRVRRRGSTRMRSCRRAPPRSVPRRTWPARPQRSPPPTARPGPARRARGSSGGSGHRGWRRSPASCQLSPNAGARSAAARSASTVARTRPRGASVQSSIARGKRPIARIIRRGHVEELGRRGTHAPPQDPRHVGGLGVEPLREALGSAFAQDAVESGRIAHREPDVADFGHSDAV